MGARVRAHTCAGAHDPIKDPPCPLELLLPLLLEPLLPLQPLLPLLLSLLLLQLVEVDQ